ncbi:MAG TPA: histidine kinase [Blastocatellia bacterium]|nr:histidine kinase [Blastocatellia bacterium]
MWRRHRILWTSIAAGWLLIALSFTLNYYLFSSHYVEIFSPPPTLAQMLIWEIPYWLLWAMMAPLVFLITRRFPLERESWLRNATVHVIACFLLSVAHRIIYLPICWLLYVDAYRRIPTLIGLYSSDLFFNLPTGFMSYGTILLVSNVTDYYERYQAGELRASQLETQLAQAQLQALRMQLQPHFLFNTLNSISALQLTDVQAANAMTARLGDFLRLTLDNAGTQEVTLREEMEFLRCYLEIERVRFQDRMQVTIEVEPETLDVQVPNLILQPIVENSIRYAVMLRAAAGHIQIRAQRINGFVRIEVQDDGPGLQMPRNSNRVTRGGIGLTNTQARLRELYGSAHRFELTDAPDGGLVVTLEIPAHHSENRFEG